MKAIQAIARGAAAESLRVTDIEAPKPPAEGEVLVDVEYAPLNEHDLLAVAGLLPGGTPPWVPGNEGSGIVSETGPGVSNVKTGDRVLLPPASGSFRQQLNVPAAAVLPLPDADPQQLAMMMINPPTAALLLSDVTDIPAGGWVVQNAANSGVGRTLTAVASARGIKTVNFARNASAFDELRGFGADIVLPDTPEGAAAAKEMIGDATVPLAVDGVGGPSTMNLLSVVTEGAVVAAYSAVSGQPMWLPALVMSHYHVTARGFFVFDYDMATKIVPAVQEVAPLVAAAKFTVPVAGVYGLDQLGQALDHLRRGGGKILLSPNGAGLR